MNSSGNYSNTIDLFIRQVGFAYVIPATATVGFIFNTISLVVFFSRQFNTKMYRYLKVKTISDLILTAITSWSIMANCGSCGLNQNFYVVWCKQIFVNLFNISAYNLSGFVEVAIIYDRYLMLASKSPQGACVRKKLPFRVTIIALVATSLLTGTSSFIAFNVEPIMGKNNSYTLVANSFGTSPAYTLIIGVQVLIVCLVTYIPLIVFSLLFLYEFKQYCRRKVFIIRIFNNQAASNNDEKQANLVRMMMTLIGTYIFNRTLVSFTVIARQILTFYHKNWPLVNILYFVASVLSMLTSTLNFFIYLKFNRIFFQFFQSVTAKFTNCCF